MQRNFILTDVMKTGNHQKYERFLDTHSLPDQTIEYTGEYYTLHNYDLDRALREFERVGNRYKYICVESYRTEEEKTNLLYWK